MKDDEIVLNAWLAEDLAAKPGDEVTLKYFVLGPTGGLTETSSKLRVREIVPIEGAAADKTLMPDFPGLAGVANCRDWKPGLPIDVKKIRKKDEGYWAKYRGTPKAFVTLAAGRKMWANRFGDLTAIRFPMSPLTLPSPARGEGKEAPLTLPSPARGEGKEAPLTLPSPARGEGKEAPLTLPSPSRGEGTTERWTEESLSEALRKNLDPASFGLVFRPVGTEAQAGPAATVDFGQLFLGFSFFLIIAAMLLVGLLFRFGIEERTEEIGTLLALGLSPAHVLRIMLLEGGALAVLGAVVGVFLGTLYTRAMLWGLATVWSQAVGAARIVYHADGATLLIGGAAGVLVATLTIWLGVRRLVKRPARELLAGMGAEPVLARRGGPMWPPGRFFGFGRGKATATTPPLTLPSPARGEATTAGRPHGAAPTTAQQQPGMIYHAPTKGSGRASLWIAIASGAGAAVLLALMAFVKDARSEGAFFGAGALLLIAGLAISDRVLTALAQLAEAKRLTLGGLGLRNVTRRRGRSLATVALLACGVFLIVAVGANRIDPSRDSLRRAAGTGGFALYGESSMSVRRDLNTPAGRQGFGLPDAPLEGVEFVPLRVHAGDDASCLNLARARRPGLLGVDPQALAKRGAFTFVGVFVSTRPPAEPAPPRAAEPQGSYAHSMSPWLLLENQQPDRAVPAIADDTTITWSLGLKVGDTLDYPDERGGTFKVRLVGALANSILQGRLVIAERDFVARFPSEGGYRAMLVDAPPAKAEEASRVLSRGLSDVGLALEPAAARLASFAAVENTYLAIFQALGGLGLLLGSAGLGLVVLRNVLERRGELALLRAVGFSRGAVRWLVLSEHWGLLAMGLAVGTVSALVAVLPAIAAPGSEAPFASLAATLVAVTLSGAAWTYLAAAAALRGPLLGALRNE